MEFKAELLFVHVNSVQFSAEMINVIANMYKCSLKFEIEEVKNAG